MDKEKYDEKAKLINQISQQCECLNGIAVKISDSDFNTVNMGKLTKGITFINNFILNEKKHLKLERKKYYIQLKNK